MVHYWKLSFPLQIILALFRHKTTICDFFLYSIRARSHTSITFVIASTLLWVQSISNVLFTVRADIKLGSAPIKAPTICVNANTNPNNIAQAKMLLERQLYRRLTIWSISCQIRALHHAGVSTNTVYCRLGEGAHAFIIAQSLF